MARATFWFHGALNDFLRVEQRRREVGRAFAGSPSVKDQVEACGVPHTEVEALVVNGASVGFDYRLRDGDGVCVYPRGVATGVVPLVTLRPPVPAGPGFVADVHLGALARGLRLLGFDTLWEREAGDERLVALAQSGPRVLLTRDRGLLMRREVVHGAAVHATAPAAQLREVVDRYALASWAAPFTRCLRCNGRLSSVAKELVAGRVLEGTWRRVDAYVACTGCGQVFWWGAHAARLRATVEAALAPR